VRGSIPNVHQINIINTYIRTCTIIHANIRPSLIRSCMHVNWTSGNDAVVVLLHSSRMRMVKWIEPLVWVK
jgi:hypothetical protein